MAHRKKSINVERWAHPKFREVDEVSTTKIVDQHDHQIPA